MLYGLKVLYVI